MKQVFKLTMLAVGTMTAFASLPVQAAQVCVPGRGCVRTTQAAYNQCFELSQPRGVSEQRARAGTWFIYQSLKGRIARQSQVRLFDRQRPTSTRCQPVMRFTRTNVLPSTPWSLVLPQMRAGSTRYS